MVPEEEAPEKVTAHAPVMPTAEAPEMRFPTDQEIENVSID